MTPCRDAGAGRGEHVGALAGNTGGAPTGAWAGRRGRTRVERSGEGGAMGSTRGTAGDAGGQTVGNIALYICLSGAATCGKIVDSDHEPYSREVTRLLGVQCHKAGTGETPQHALCSPGSVHSTFSKIPVGIRIPCWSRRNSARWRRRATGVVDSHRCYSLICAMHGAERRT